MFNKSVLIVPLQDLLGYRQQIYDNKTHIQSAFNWLKRAQDIKKSGGVSTGYSLLKGWLPEYIETTGYIISSFLEASIFFRDRAYKKRAIKMADFLVSVQLSNGGFRTYPSGVSGNSGPTIFNSGQDLLGMADIYLATRKVIYLRSLVKVADFLVRAQNINGSWEKYSYDGKAHSYDARVGFALIKAYEITKNPKYLSSGRKSLDWAVSLQTDNGWLKEATLPYPNPPQPYTHTLSYCLEGLLLAGLEIGTKKYIATAKKTADRLLEYFNKNNYLPGTLDQNWSSSDRYSCLTGDAQISGIWLRLFSLTKERKYLQASRRMNTFLKSTQQINSNDLNIRGGIKGCNPIYGDLLKMRGYCRMTYINWAVKFFIDALLLEELFSKAKRPTFI